MKRLVVVALLLTSFAARAADDFPIPSKSRKAEVAEDADSAPRERIKRHPVRNVWYLALGGAAFSNLAAGNFGTNVAAGYGWDLDRVYVKFLLDLSMVHSAFFGTLSLAAAYHLLPTETTPYLSAEFGTGVAKADADNLFSGKTISGFLVAGGGGVLFFRESSVNLDLGARIGVLLNTNALGHPNVVSLRLGLYF